jgi:pyruvate/2-oxoglutarate dehydrogenase complex dihydrolipoamide acyltransferase (E2) component
MEAIVTILRVPKSGGIGTTKVKVVRWLKREGDRVTRGEPVVELETEKVNYELDSAIEGVVVKILARETDEVPVGDPLCEIDLSPDAAPIAKP